MEKHFDILLKGKMKDHGCAFLAMKEADKLNIKGLAGYTDDNYLLIQIEGEEAKLQQFIKWCKLEMPGPNVDEILITPNKHRCYSDFEIRNLMTDKT